MEGHATMLTLKSEIDMSMVVLMPPHIAEMVRGSRYGVPVASDRCGRQVHHSVGERRRRDGLEDTRLSAQVGFGCIPYRMSQVPSSQREREVRASIRTKGSTSSYMA